jgi:segregation and condensation protein A
MAAAPVTQSFGPGTLFPPIALPFFEGPLDLLLHLIREHKIEIADIPIGYVTDHYLAYLRAMEAMNLNIAGEFILMAATLMEIKSRMLLPKPERLDIEGDPEGEDPRMELVRTLREYQQYQALVPEFAGWEEARRKLFFREQMSYGDLYELPIEFGELNVKALVQAMARLLTEAGVGAETSVTSVRRQKLTLRLAMAALWRKIRDAGAPVLFEECFPVPLVRLEIVMTFLAMLELLRQGLIAAKQDDVLGPIWITEAEKDEAHAAEETDSSS